MHNIILYRMKKALEYLESEDCRRAAREGYPGGTSIYDAERRVYMLGLDEVLRRFGGDKYVEMWPRVIQHVPANGHDYLTVRVDSIVVMRRAVAWEEECEKVRKECGR